MEDLVEPKFFGCLSLDSTLHAIFIPVAMNAVMYPAYGIGFLSDAFSELSNHGTFDYRIPLYLWGVINAPTTMMTYVALSSFVSKQEYKLINITIGLSSLHIIFVILNEFIFTINYRWKEMYTVYITIKITLGVIAIMFFYFIYVLYKIKIYVKEQSIRAPIQRIQIPRTMEPRMVNLFLHAVPPATSSSNIESRTQTSIELENTMGIEPQALVDQPPKYDELFNE